VCDEDERAYDYDTVSVDNLTQGSPNFFIEGPQKISNALSGPKVN